MTNSPTKSTWGGKRPGAGRRPTYREKMGKQVLVKLTEEQLALYRKIGGADWVREQLDRILWENQRGTQAGEKIE